MLDADPARLTRNGTVTIPAKGMIMVEGFQGKGCTCRDVSALALVWAIGRLQHELLKTLEAPGGGDVGIG